MPLSNSQYDNLTREYNEKQIRNQHILDERKKDVYSRSPRLREIEKEISSLSVSSAEKMLYGDENAIEQLKTEINKLGSERISILASMGFHEDFLTTPPYDCPDCKDTGYIENERCHCFRQRAIDIVYTQSNLKNILREENFDKFTLDYYPKNDINPFTQVSSYESMSQYLETAKDFVTNFDNEFENIFLSGTTGVGKTFLSNCIAKELLDTSHSVIYLSAFQLFDIFRNVNFNKDSLSAMQGDNIMNCDLLIIDDLGTEVSNSFTNSQLFLCLNERILHRKSTIISTNLSLSELSGNYSDRIFSRIANNYHLLLISGEDIRVRKKKDEYKSN